jgi:thiamine biosynthesis lipoprotein
MKKSIKPARKVRCSPREGGFTLSFFSMASTCEVLIDTHDKKLAKEMGTIAANEAWRIEDKYSRYDINSHCGQINAKSGESVAIDSETFQLLEFAQQCFDMSEGAFDMTSGILRKAWQFDGSDNVPSDERVNALLHFVGWNKVTYTPEFITMQKGMEIDFGGLGKEYAVDRTVLLLNEALLNKRLRKTTNAPFLVNYGGDLAVSGSRSNNEAWQIGIDHPSFKTAQSIVVTLKKGAIATSGDANRFLLKDGCRYSHILDVSTGWPVEQPPNSITVAAPQCIQAGFLATLALLQGVNAESFLTQQDIMHWSIR